MLWPAIRTHLYGALLLATFKPHGFQMMETTLAGARFSFIAALLAAPLYVILLLTGLPDDIDAARYIVVHAISYIVQLAMMPLLLFYVCEVMGKARAWPRLVVPYNWLSVWQSVLYLVSAVVFDNALAEDGSLNSVVMPAILVVLGFYIVIVQGWIYNRVLQAGLLAPILLVVLNMVVDWQLGMARFALLSPGLSNPPV